MADISKVNLFGTQYNIADTEARKRVPESLLKDTVGWVGKNKNGSKYVNETSATVQFTANDDGTVKVNGTATGGNAQTSDSVEYRFTAKETLQVILSGVLSTAPDGLEMFPWDYTTGTRPYTDSTKTTVQSLSVIKSRTEVPFYMEKDHVYYIRVRLGQNKTAINEIVYPMLRDASITDSTYEPYHKSVEAEIEQVYADNGVLGAKNWFDSSKITENASWVSVTNKGKNIAVTNDTAGTYKRAVWTIPVEPNTNYDVSSDAVITSGGAQIRVYPVGSVDLIAQSDVLSSSGKISFSFNSGNNASIRLFLYCTISTSVIGTVSYDNLLIKLASDPDDTYVPYAMTNRELTEKANTYGLLLPSTTDLNNIIENGIYYSNNVTTNAPTGILSNYYGIIVMAWNENNVRQLLIAKDTIYTRSKGGSPVVWSDWYKYTGTVVS